MKLRLLGLLLLLPAFYLGGKLAGNQLEEMQIASAEHRPMWSDTPGLAVATARNYVKQELRCPATASFPLTAKAERTGDGWKVASYVDAQNGFGAHVRTHWTATVKDCGAGRWQLVDLQWGK